MANLYVRSTDGSDTDNGTTWALAKATLAGALAIATASDTIWVSQVHAETAAAAKTLTFPTTPGLRVLCGNDAAEPPTALATTATVTTTGNNALTFTGGFAYIFGIAFASGTGNSGASDPIVGSVGTELTHLVFDTCKIQSLSTNAGAPIALGTTAGGTNVSRLVEFLNTSFRFGATGHSFLMRFGRFIFVNCTLDAAGSAPTTLVAGNAGVTLEASFSACDLSGVAWTNLIDVSGPAGGSLLLRNCKLASSIVVSTGTHPGPGGVIVRMHNCDSTNTNFRVAEHHFRGVVVQETVLVRTDGASDGVTPFSVKMTSGAATFLLPLTSLEMALRQNVIGAPKIITVEYIHDGAAALTNAKAWIEVQALTTSGFPLATITSSRVATVIATPANNTASTVAWDSLVVLRQDSVAYSLGNMRKVASNPGRVFICTTAGTSAGSEPAGYASAVDGGSVTDGTAVFRAMRREKMTVTVTPQVRGTLVAVVKLAEPSYVLYADLPAVT